MLFAGALVNIAALFLGGCVSSVPFTTNPPGASVSANGRPLGSTPFQISLEGEKDVNIEVSKEGYFVETFSVNPKSLQGSMNVDLSSKTLQKDYQIETNPAGATVELVGSRVLGTTPFGNFPLVFSRSAKNAPWMPHKLKISKTDYQTEFLEVGSGLDKLPVVSLTLIRDKKAYLITAKTPDGAELHADVVLGGEVVGQTPYTLPIVYSRPDKTKAWPEFEVKVGINAKYIPEVRKLTYTSPDSLDLELKPVLEINAPFVAPALVLSPTGVVLKPVTTPSLAVLSTRETSEVVTDLKPVTDYRRKDLDDSPATRAECINSFCVSSDGQNVIFSLTERDESNNLFANLFIKRSDDTAGGVARLTQGARSFDTLPYIANDGSNYLVFASNRSDRNKPDIYRVNLIDNRLSGGISRLTNDNRFNYSPSYGDSNRQLFYLSTEPNFPKAESVVSSIRIDGSLPTQMPVNALEVNNSFPEKVYFVRLDDDTKKKQIYSITADGKLETALISQEDLRRSNCFNVAVSPDGTRVLFVSDGGTDEKGRHNDDIYMCNADGTDLRRLTQNGSDDLAPAWSPTEEGVVFFLSNRGGAYNIWRMKLIGGSK